MKILGSDFDGTLTHGGIGEDKLEAIRKWREKGHKFGIVSGRGRDFRDTLRCKTPGLRYDFLAVCNGGYIMDSDGAVIYEVRCTDVSVVELVTDLFAWGCDFARIIGEPYLFAAANEQVLLAYPSETCACLPEKMPVVDFFNQISVRLPSVGEAADVTAKIREKYARWLNPLQNARSIDIVPAGVDKARGMLRVMEYFGGSYENVITVGDNVNDLDMIREFRSYAMENGVDEVKKQANAVVADVTGILEKEM